MKDYNFSKILKEALSSGGEFADIFLESSRETFIQAEDDRIERVICGEDRGVGMRVIFNGKTVYAFSNDLTEKSLLDMARQLNRIVKKGPGQGDIELRKKEAPIKLPILKHPDTISLDQKISMVNGANILARGYAKEIRQVKIIYRDGEKNILIANSHGNLVEENRIGTIFLVQVVAIENDIIQTGYELAGGSVGFELFDEYPPEETARKACARALLMLKARHAPGGEMPVVLSSEAGGTMIHEAVGHGLEADLIYQGLSVYAEKLEQMVASPLITAIDDATLPGKRGSFCFDDEGTPSQRTILVERGILKGYMCDILTGMKMNIPSTGNGRRESYRSKPIVRMSNTFIAPGESSPEEIIRSTEKGILVKKMGGGQVNTINGNFVFEVSEGYLIEKGVIGEAVRGAILTGNGPEVLKDIDMVGNDLGFGIGTCGKDGQGVPVSDAQPTLRIGKLIVGGAAKSS